MLIYRVLFSQNRKNDRSNLNWTIDKHPGFNASLVYTHTYIRQRLQQKFLLSDKFYNWYRFLKRNVQKLFCIAMMKGEGRGKKKKINK